MTSWGCRAPKLTIDHSRRKNGVATGGGTRFSDEVRWLAHTALTTGLQKWKVDLTSPARPLRLSMTSLLDMTLTIRSRVREMRVERGWTQQDLADQVGVSRQSINSIENDRYVPSLPLALTFARVFKCTTDDIFTLEKRR